MNKKFYISDLHFDHASAIDLDGRPFKTVEEMNITLIENWNSVVDKDDEIYILGDFCWKTQKRWIELLDQLNGVKYLIRGNHDLKKMPVRLKKKFKSIYDYVVIKDNGRHVVLSHYPIASWYGMYRGWIHLYGHVHATYDETLFLEHMNKVNEYLGEQGKYAQSYNVGCMKSYMNYIPKTLDEIIDGCKEYE